MDRPQQIVVLATAFAAAEDLPLKTVSKRVFDSSSRVDALKAGGDLYSRTGDAAVTWFADRWPTKTPWPERIQMPPGVEAPNRGDPNSSSCAVAPVAAVAPPSPSERGGLHG